MGEKEGRRGGRKKVSAGLVRLDPGWGGVVVTGLTLTHLMPVYLSSPFPFSLFQVCGKRTEGNTRIHYLSEVCTRDLFVWLPPEIFLFFFLFSFGVRKRRSKLSSPSKQHWRLGGFFLFFPQREWTENLGFKVLVFFVLLFVLCHERDEGRWFLMEVKVSGAGRIPS